MSFQQSFLLVLRLQVRLFSLTRRLMWLAPLWVLLLVALVLSALGTSGSDAERVQLFAFYVGAAPLGFLGAFSALLMSNAVFADDAENGMAPYLLSRPVPRSAILLGRALPLWLIINVPAFLCALVLGAMAGFAPVMPGLLALIPLSLAASALYLGLFVALTLAVKRALVAGFAFIVLVELLLGALPLRIAWVSPRYHLMSLWSTAAGGQDLLQHSAIQMKSPSLVTSLIFVASMTLFVWLFAASRLQKEEV